jgi:hypothetical protein
MSGNPQRKSGKKNRKFGRAGRKPSHNRYNAERRWEKNKARRAAKIQKQLEKKAARKARKAANI